MSGEIARNAVIASLLLAGAAGPVWAGAVCYARDYSDDHLARNPSQVVRSIRLRMPEEPRLEVIWIAATLADQGHVAGTAAAGQTLTQGLYCYPDSDPMRCAVECDGGLMTVTRREGDMLEFQTEYLIVGDSEECGGEADLAEMPGQVVTYRLFKSDPELCEEG